MLGTWRLSLSGVKLHKNLKLPKVTKGESRPCHHGHCHSKLWKDQVPIAVSIAKLAQERKSHQSESNDVALVPSD